MFSVTEYLEDLKEAFIPTVAKAEDEVDEDEEEEDEDEDEEDEDEASDQMEALRKAALETPEGQELHKHYLDCVARVEKAKESPDYDSLDYKEDCVEEFFHLQHYSDSQIAPRLFSKLK
ncbi:hypothetical protein TPHA_0C04470 [Tetrapisispora phaffii CBS 4417]|uniref:Ubiquinol-cytochrome C reductase hinge domain-containing protein n=1 Tax=Tetrapisispora phaffii (strain ATCC 24235 / CBS 4417 / NBRC 1672 / NRRL Y-8282 / UCD 70-5) TaxID=1071381 RepID=G8BQT6_TETPH|nr:hypothetical protein TPHA_0C04470 [Tetrapisispora phaffii CBS 4417]CCE62598.1 hypothetical protein TPHA_0C04470 [Tetrapisispora phaffii CBS 4417]